MLIELIFLLRCLRVWWWTTATSSSETLSPVRATSCSRATGSRKPFTLSSGRRWFSPVRRTPGCSTAWRTKRLTLCRLLFTSTWAARRLWPGGARLRFSSHWTGLCLSATCRPPSALLSAPRQATERGGSVRKGNISLTYITFFSYGLISKISNSGKN